jgi:hypothetical protein
VGLFDEGLAVHLGQELTMKTGWWGKTCDAFAREAIAADRLPPLASIVTPEQMYTPPWSVVGRDYYPSACSFVAYLVRKHGMARLRAFLGAYDCATQDDAAAVKAAFARVFGASLDDEDRAWRGQI